MMVENSSWRDIRFYAIFMLFTVFLEEKEV